MSLGSWITWRLAFRGPEPIVEARITDAEERALLRAARQRPQDADAHAALGAHLLRQRRPHAAIWALQDARDLRPADLELRWQLARALVVAHLPRVALRFLTQSQPASTGAQTASDIETRRVAAAAYLAMGDPVSAVGILTAADTALASSAPALLDLGTAYEAMGDDLAAESAYGRHLQRAPASTEGYLALGRLLARQGRVREALAAFAHARRTAPDDLRPLFHAALARLRGGAGPGGAAPPGAPGAQSRGTALLLRLAQADPPYAPARLQLGLWLLRQGRPAEAVPHLEAAREAGAGVGEARLHLATALAAAGRSADAVYQRGVHYLETRQLPLALREFRQLARWEPDAPRADVMISTAYARMEDRARAAEAAGRGLLRHPEDPQLLSLRAKMLAMSDDRAAAARLCRQWRARDPEAAAPLAILSSIEREALRYPEAVRLAEQAVAVDPANAEHHRELGRALAALATPDSLRRAAAALQEAAERAPDDAKAPLLLAEVLQKLGDAEGARRQYARALDLDPSSRQAAVGLLQLSSQVGQSGRVAFYSEIVRALQERGDAAAVLWRRVYESDHDADAHARLAQLFLDAGDISQARYPLRRAVALRPGDKARAQQLRMIERLIELRQP